LVILASGAGLARTGWGADPSAGRSGPLYGGRTLAAWRELIKTEPTHALAEPELVTGLMEVAADPQAPWADRRQCALTLGRIGPAAQPAVPLLTRLLTNHEPDPQATTLWALRALGLMGTAAADASGEVAKIVADSAEPYLVRASAMETLARIGPQQAMTLPVLLQVLSADRERTAKGNADELRLAAADCLGLLGSGAAPAVPELVRALASDWPLLARSAATTLGQIGPRADLAVPALADVVLLSDAGEAREAAAEALGRIGAAGLPALAQLLGDGNLEVREFAMRGLERSLPEAAPLLRRGLSDPAAAVRVAAAGALLTRAPGDSQSVEVLLSVLQSEDREARRGAYRALRTHVAELGAYRPQFETLRTNPAAPPEARRAAEWLLEHAPL
jgi:HEAT repeat protein